MQPLPKYVCGQGLYRLFLTTACNYNHYSTLTRKNKVEGSLSHLTKEITWITNQWGDKKASLKLFCEGINNKSPELSAKEEALYLFNIWQGWQRVVLQKLRCCERSQVLLGHILISKWHTARWKQQERPRRNDESQSSRISCNWKGKEKQKPPWKWSNVVWCPCWMLIYYQPTYYEWNRFMLPFPPVVFHNHNNHLNFNHTGE